MDCCKCCKPIPEARLKALPNTKTCIECSNVERNYVRTIISGKTTYSEWEVIKNKDTKEYLQKLDSKGRQGFGSMLYRASKSIPEPKASEMSKTPKRAMRTLPEYSQTKFELFVTFSCPFSYYLHHKLGLSNEANHTYSQSDRFIFILTGLRREKSNRSRCPKN